MDLTTRVMTMADSLGLTSAPTHEDICRRSGLVRHRLEAWYYTGSRSDPRGKEVDEAIAATARELDPGFPGSMFDDSRAGNVDAAFAQLAQRVAEHMTGQGRGRLLDPPIITL